MALFAGLHFLPIAFAVGFPPVPNLGGSIISAGGLAFIGATTDQYLRAFDLNTGKVV